MEIRPITFHQAADYVNAFHRHHHAPVGCKFCLGVFDAEGGALHGVAICGRPVAKALDTGLICEINRVCTDGTYNACSMLYGACVRVARAMGYHKVITYILESENGASLRASNFVCEGKAGGVEWTGKRYTGKKQTAPHEMKTRWAYVIKKEGDSTCQHIQVPNVKQDTHSAKKNSTTSTIY